MSKPVVVVGAGPAGLVCARRLHQAGVPVLVVDSEETPGGRLRTDLVGGFRLDRGFQVLFTAYPNVRREVDIEALNGGAFQTGAYIYHDGRLNLLEPPSFVDMMKLRVGILKDKTIPFADKRRLASFAENVGQLSPRQAFGTDPMTAEDFLRDQGFGDEIIDRYFRPFFGGVFLDRELSVDSRQFMFVWGMLNQGKTILPAKGMQAVTDQIAAGIPRYLFRLGNRVSEVLFGDRGQAVGVRFDTSETLEASAVVVATEADEASRLTGQPSVQGYLSSTCLYFETPTPIVPGAHLLLNGSGQGWVNHVAPVSVVTPSYAPTGKHLVSATVLGMPDVDDAQLAQAVKDELNAWAPDKGTYMWRFIRSYRIKYAQMRQPVGFTERLPNNATKHDQLYWCGEFTENSSIDGAVRSGMECAALLLSDREASEAA